MPRTTQKTLQPQDCCNTEILQQLKKQFIEGLYLEIERQNISSDILINREKN